MMIKSSKLYSEILSNPPLPAIQRLSLGFPAWDGGSKVEAEGNLREQQVLRHSKTKINICFQFFSAQRLKVARTTSKYVMFCAILTNFTTRKHLLPAVGIHRFSKLQTANMSGYL